MPLEQVDLGLNVNRAVQQGSQLRAELARQLGDIEVGVTPTLTNQNFGDELRRALGSDGIQVPVTIDNAEISAVVDDLANAIRSEVSDVGIADAIIDDLQAVGDDIALRVDADTTPAEAAIGFLADQGIDLSAELDAADVTSEIEQEIRQADTDIPVTAETTQFESAIGSSLSRLADQLRSSIGDELNDIPPPVIPPPDVDRAAWERAINRPLDNIDPPDVPPPDIDRAAWQEAVNRALDDIPPPTVEPQPDFTQLGEAIKGIDFRNPAANFETAFTGVTDRLFASGLQGIVVGAAAAAGVAAGAAIAATFVKAFSDGIAAEEQALRDQFAAGLSDDAFAEAGREAGEVFTSGITEASFGELQSFAAQVEQALGDIDPELDLSQITAELVFLQDTVGTEVAATADIIRQLFENQLVDSADEGVELIGQAYRRLGPQADEVIDNFREFGTSLEQLGITGEQAFNSIAFAVDRDIFTAPDRLFDSLQEFTTFITSDIEKTTEGLETLGLTYAEIATLVEQGQGVEAIGRIADAARDAGTASTTTEDALTKLFGTPAEEAGGAGNFVDVLDQLTASTDGLGNSVTEATDELEGLFSSQIRGALNELSEAWRSFSGVVVGFVQDLDFSSVQRELGPAFDSLGELVTELEPALRAIGSVAGDFLQGRIEQLAVAIRFAGDRFQSFADGINLAKEGAREAAGVIADLLDAIPDSVAGFVGLGEEIAGAAESLRDIEESQTSSERAAIAHTEAQRDAAAASRDLSGANSETGDSFEGIIDGAAESVDVVDELRDSWNEFLNATNNASAGRDALADSQRAVFEFADSLEDIDVGSLLSDSGQIDITTREGLDLRDAFVEVNDELATLAERFAEDEISAEEFVLASANVRSGLEEMLKAAGATEEQIENLGDEFTGLPEQLVTELDLEFDERGFLSIQSALDLFDAQTYDAKLQFDVDNDGIVTGRELGTSFEGAVWSADLEYEVNDDELDEAIRKAEEFDRSTYLANVGFRTPDGQIVSSSGDIAFQSGNTIFQDRGAVLRGPTYLPWRGQNGEYVVGGERRTEIITPVDDMNRFETLVREAGAMDRLAGHLISRGIVGPPGTGDRAPVTVAASAPGSPGEVMVMPAMPPITVQVTPPAGMNPVAHGRETARQVGVKVRRAVWDAVQAGRSPGSFRGAP